VKPYLWTYLAARTVCYFLKRVFVCEPLLKASCKRYGKGTHTGVYVHWIHGQGDILLGDNVLLDGKCSITFSPWFTPAPTLEIGDNTMIGHGCAFNIGKRITIGKHCQIATNVWMLDSNGHPAGDPAERKAGLPPRPEEVQPIVIGDNVWIGSRSIIFPGVTIGEGSIISAGSLVRGSVPPYAVVAGPRAGALVNGQASSYPQKGGD
jgi:serine acetyltransferase